MRQFIVILCFLILPTSLCLAHGDLGRRIVAKTKAIAKDPKNADLYLQRGFLYQQHEEWDNALTDYLKSKQLGLKNKLLPYRMAEVYLELAFFKKGLACTATYLHQDSLDVKIHKLRGQLFFQSKQYLPAIQSFQYVLDHSDDLRPENYLTLVKVHFALDSTQQDTILTVINQGIQQLGVGVFVLQEQKLIYLKKFQQVNAVLQQYDLLIQQNRRKEGWYYQKALYLYQQEQYLAAKTTVDAAQVAFHQLKPHKQKTTAMMQLLANIHILIQKISNQ